jgi:cell division transport system permease protein
MKPYIAAKLSADAFRSIRRNLPAGIAGLLLSAAAFFSLGAGLAVYINVDRNIERILALPELEVFMYPDAVPADKGSLEEKLRNTPGVLEIKYVSKDDAFRKAGEMLGGDSDVLDMLGKDFLPESFIVDTDKGYDYKGLIDAISSYDETESIKYSGDEIMFINKITGWSKYLSLIIFAVTLFFSFVTIASLVTITVYSRKKEIMLKRYMGAGSFFIILPFILQGVIISFIGAVVSWLIFSAVYGSVTEMFRSYMSGSSAGIFVAVPLNDIRFVLLLFVLPASLIFGSLSGLFAVKRHLLLGGH